MLSFYLSTVITWFIIIVCTIFIFAKTISERYYMLDSDMSYSMAWFYLFLICCVPFLRVFFEAFIIIAATCPEDMRDDIVEKINKTKE